MDKIKTSVITKAALLTAVALIFSYIEAILPFNIGIPGVKLGLANVVIVYAIYTLGVKYAILISVCRVLLSALLFGNVYSLVYSAAGAVLSLLVMILLKKWGIFSICGVSAAGGVFHNLGQIIVAGLIIKVQQVFLYFPVLVFSGIVTGVLNGIITVLCIKKIIPGSGKDEAWN